MGKKNRRSNNNTKRGGGGGGGGVRGGGSGGSGSGGGSGGQQQQQQQGQQIFRLTNNGIYNLASYCCPSQNPNYEPIIVQIMDIITTTTDNNASVVTSYVINDGKTYYRNVYYWNDNNDINDDINDINDNDINMNINDIESTTTDDIDISNNKQQNKLTKFCIIKIHDYVTTNLGSYMNSQGELATNTKINLLDFDIIDDTQCQNCCISYINNMLDHVQARPKLKYVPVPLTKDGISNLVSTIHDPTTKFKPITVQLVNNIKKQKHVANKDDDDSMDDNYYVISDGRYLLKNIVIYDLKGENISTYCKIRISKIYVNRDGNIVLHKFYVLSCNKVYNTNSTYYDNTMIGNPIDYYPLIKVKENEEPPTTNTQPHDNNILTNDGIETLINYIYLMEEESNNDDDVVSNKNLINEPLKLQELTFDGIETLLFNNMNLTEEESNNNDDDVDVDVSKNLNDEPLQLQVFDIKYNTTMHQQQQQHNSNIVQFSLSDGNYYLKNVTIDDPDSIIFNNNDIVKDRSVLFLNNTIIRIRDLTEIIISKSSSSSVSSPPPQIIKLNSNNFEILYPYHNYGLIGNPIERLIVDDDTDTTATATATASSSSSSSNHKFDDDDDDDTATTTTNTTTNFGDSMKSSEHEEEDDDEVNNGNKHVVVADNNLIRPHTPPTNNNKTDHHLLDDNNCVTAAVAHPIMSPSLAAVAGTTKDDVASSTTQQEEEDDEDGTTMDNNEEEVLLKKEPPSLSTSLHQQQQQQQQLQMLTPPVEQKLFFPPALVTTENEVISFKIKYKLELKKIQRQRNNRRSSTKSTTRTSNENKIEDDDDDELPYDDDDGIETKSVRTSKSHIPFRLKILLPDDDDGNHNNNEEHSSSRRNNKNNNNNGWMSLYLLCMDMDSSCCIPPTKTVHTTGNISFSFHGGRYDIPFDNTFDCVSGDYWLLSKFVKSKDVIPHCLNKSGIWKIEIHFTRIQIKDNTLRGYKTFLDFKLQSKEVIRNKYSYRDFDQINDTIYNIWLNLSDDQKRKWMVSKPPPGFMVFYQVMAYKIVIEGSFKMNNNNNNNNNNRASLKQLLIGWWRSSSEDFKKIFSSNDLESCVFKLKPYRLFCLHHWRKMISNMRDNNKNQQEGFINNIAIDEQSKTKLNEMWEALTDDEKEQYDDDYYYFDNDITLMDLIKSHVIC